MSMEPKYVESINFNLTIDVSLDKQPTIQGGIGGSVLVKLKRGLEVKLLICWDDCPFIMLPWQWNDDMVSTVDNLTKLTLEEIDEIDEIVSNSYDHNSSLLGALEEAVDKIENIEIDHKIKDLLATSRDHTVKETTSRFLDACRDLINSSDSEKKCAARAALKWAEFQIATKDWD